MKSGKGRKTAMDEDPVEQLLQAVQDDLMLNLNVDSHMSRISPDYLDSDLDRRFKALKSRSKHSSSAPPPSQPQSHSRSQSGSKNENLSARFESLKASLPSNSSSSVNAGKAPIVVTDDDEVEKLIEWAKDAARLDPSPPSDDDDDDDDDKDSCGSDDDTRPSSRQVNK